MDASCNASIPFHCTIDYTDRRDETRRVANGRGNLLLGSSVLVRFDDDVFILYKFSAMYDMYVSYM